MILLLATRSEVRKTLAYSSSRSILLTSFNNVMPSYWFHMIYILLYMYFGFHRPMLGKFTKALLAGTMAGRSSGTFQKGMYIHCMRLFHLIVNKLV